MVIVLPAVQEEFVRAMAAALWKTPVSEFPNFVFAHLLVKVLELDSIPLSWPQLLEEGALIFCLEFLICYCINIDLVLCLLFCVVKRVTAYVSFGIIS